MGILSFLGFDGAGEQEPVELSDANFGAEVARSGLPVMVDVWSAGCQPCAALVERVVGLRGQHYYEEIIEEELLGNVARKEAAS